MVPSDGDRRAAEFDAYGALWNLWRAAQVTPAIAGNWESARAMLQTYYTVRNARRDPESCAMRIRYLEISQPPPRLADFVDVPPYYGLPDAPRRLAQARYEYQLARRGYPERERQRLRELETTRALYASIKAAEAMAETARRREWQQSRWPKDVVLERDVYNLDGLATQVERQNAKIDSHVAALTGLLRDGLRNLPECDPADGVVAQVESVLAALPLPPGIVAKAKVGYSTGRLAVEYELPTVDVVPKVKSYRYVANRQTVVAAARPASQVKALYASTIAQLTLLVLAAILKSDSEHHIDVVVFNGVVAAVDPRGGQPIRPCLISVRATADALGEIDAERVDPSGCLKRLSATVSRNPTGLVPVRPLPG